ncbi:MAG: TAXI family TRAP transporter solute-binding subunit [Kiloniellaceae bacterium]
MLRPVLTRGVASAFAALLLGIAGTTAHAQGKPTIVPILSCPFGCGVVEGNTIFGTIMAKNGEPVMVAAQETPGYMYNVRAMAEQKRWKSNVFGTEDVIIQLALQGGTPELKEFLPKPVPIKFKLLHGEAYWAQGKFFVTTNPDIKTIADLKGKRVSLGLRGQSDWGVYPRLILEHAYGITPDNTDIRHMTPGALTQQLIDGTTDVAVTGFGTDPSQSFHLITGPLRKLQASGRKLYYIPIDQWAVDKVNAKFGTTFVTKVVKAGTMPQQDADLLIGFVRGYKAVHPAFPEEVAYNFVKAVYKYGEEMKPLSALWGMLTPEMMVDGLTEENAHPGAVRALKEIGIWDLRQKSTPVTYPKM